MVLILKGAIGGVDRATEPILTVKATNIDPLNVVRHRMDGIDHIDLASARFELVLNVAADIDVGLVMDVDAAVARQRPGGRILGLVVIEQSLIQGPRHGDAMATPIALRDKGRDDIDNRIAGLVQRRGRVVSRGVDIVVGLTGNHQPRIDGEAATVNAERLIVFPITLKHAGVLAAAIDFRGAKVGHLNQGLRRCRPRRKQERRRHGNHGPNTHMGYPLTPRQKRMARFAPLLKSSRHCS